MLRVNRLLADQLMQGYRAKAEQVFGYAYAGAASKAMPVMPDTATDVGLIPEILADLDLQDGELTYGARQNDPSDYDIRNESYQQYWQNYWMNLCEETKADMEAQSGRKFEDFYQEIKNQIASNEFSGSPVLKLTEMLEQWFDEDNKWKARRIAVTESNRISNSGFLADTQDDDIVVGYEYLVSADACPLCIAVGEGADGLPRQVAKGSPFAQRLDGDPYYRTLYTPPLHPHCRCTLVPVLDVDETRFGPSAKIEKGKIVDPGGKPVVRPPLVEVEGVNVPEKPAEPKPKKPRKPRKPKGTAGVAQVEPPQPEPVNVLSESERDRAAILEALEKWQADPSLRIDYGQTYPDMLVAEYMRRVVGLKTEAIKRLGDMDEYKLVSSGKSPLNDEELGAIEAMVLKQSMKEQPYFSIEEVKGTYSYEMDLRDAIKKAESEKRVAAMDAVRDAAFGLLAVAPDRKMVVTEKVQKYKAVSSKIQAVHDARMKSYVKALNRIKPAIGKGGAGRGGNFTDREIGFQLRTKSVITSDINNGHFAGYKNEMYVGVGDKVDESTVAHELGHALALSQDLSANGKRPGPMLHSTLNFDNWVDRKSSIHQKVSDDILFNGRNIFTEYSSTKGKNGSSYATDRANYMLYSNQGTRHELPSILMEAFYRDPVAFVRHLSPHTQAVLFGFLDGSLRE